MASIDISKNHSMSLEDAKKEVEGIANDLKEKMGIGWSWAGDQLKFAADSGAAKGVKGTIDVTGSNVRVQVDLPFLLKAMKGTISGKIEDKLSKFS